MDFLKRLFHRHNYIDFCFPFPEQRWRIHGYCDKCDKWIAVWMLLK